MKMKDLKIDDAIKFEYEGAVLEGKIIALHKYDLSEESDEQEEYSYQILAEVPGHDIDYKLSLNCLL